ncbi:MAG: c-type cytochrome [Pseudomonadales bacterium]|nr:c-type cytochrome [Pseudomonadales bacterium]
MIRDYSSTQKVLPGSIKIFFILFFVIFAVCSCSVSPTANLSTSQGSPASDKRIKLGEKLFFDKLLSADKSMSCSTCHKPEHGFADPVEFSQGVRDNQLARHTPHLMNLSGGSSFFWDGRSPSLAKQALDPIKNPDEMDLPPKQMMLRLRNDTEYPDLFNAAFPNSGLKLVNVGLALAAFERTLVADNTPFDRFQAGDKTAMSASAQRGMKLFFSPKTNCSKCHSGNNLTDGKFHNTGLIGDDLGRAAIDRVGNFQMRPYPFFQTQKAFKTPGLRNIAFSAPYMHNGVFKNLKQVIVNYNAGSQDPESYGISLDIRQIGLTDKQIDDLVTFLQEGLTSPRTFAAPTTGY